MPRLLFEKVGEAVWISHLDLMRVFQRAFKRAGLPLTHSQGFNPRPSVSIALPLSVGVSSKCELLDFALDGCNITCDEIRSRLNETLISGVRVLDVYEEGRKIRDLSLLRCEIHLEYAQPVLDDAIDEIRKLFIRDDVVLPKKTKNGIKDENIIPMIRNILAYRGGEQEVILNAVICCQNPTLNPMQLVNAIASCLPHLKPTFSYTIRQEIYDNDEVIFR
jgi:radical SAM-linked protein